MTFPINENLGNLYAKKYRDSFADRQYPPGFVFVRRIFIWEVVQLGS